MKKYYFIILTVLSLALISACSSNEKVAKNEEKTSGEEIEVKDSKKISDTQDEVDKQDLGKRTQTFEGKLDIEHSFKDKVALTVEKVSVSVIALKDEQKQYYEDQSEIGIVSVKTIVENKSDDEIEFYGNGKLVTENGFEAYGDTRFTSFSMTEPLKKGDKSTGYFVFVVPVEELEAVKNGMLTIESPTIDTTPIDNDFITTLPFTEEAKANQGDASNQPFMDRIVAEGLGVKEVIKTMRDLNLKGKTGDIDITLHDIQTAKLIVNEANKEAFDGLTEVNTVTFSVEAKNNGKEAVNFNLNDGTLNVNDYYTIFASLLSDQANSGELKPGESKDGYVVFLVHPDDFKDFKNVSIKFRGPDALDFSEQVGEDVTIKLPME